MRFSDYLKSKRNTLILWFCFHGFALFINLINTTNSIHASERRNFFTTKNYNIQKEESAEFWPFVKFLDSGGYYNPYNSKRESWNYFNGIFYQYGISEFFAYSILILLILYISWDHKIVEESRNKSKEL